MEQRSELGRAGVRTVVKNGIGMWVGKIWVCEGVWIMSAASISVLGLEWLRVQHPHPDVPQPISAQPRSQPSTRPPGPEMGVPAPQGKWLQGW